MTTLESIGFTIAGGSVIFISATSLFGIAVAKRSPYIAPRCTARPRNVIYNPTPSHTSQERGSPMLGWIPWTLGLTYDTMLRGVPGTGTREGGLSGSLLKVTLDSVVLLRFHAMCLRVSAVACFLCVVVILPTYLTAQCYQWSQEENLTNSTACSNGEYNLTNYEQTTLANVPSLSDADEYTADTGAVFAPSSQHILVRLYAVCFCFWIICYYCCRQLREEWIALLAMRRVYYLEYDHWRSRREELKNTLMYEEERQKKAAGQVFTFDETKDTDIHLTKRDPWIPHPEQRDTVPNVALYSLLVGGLPSLPEQAAEAFDAESTINFSKRESIDWQLSITSTFFDHCVPNQPGFSSSVAAVTIIPGANDLSRAWRKWITAAKKLRRLKFIREQIAERRHYDIIVEDDGPGEERQIMRDLELGGVNDSQLLVEETPKVYGNETRNQEYYRQVLGTAIQGEEESHIFEAPGFGPEQTAIYSREFAQASANCCPNGCCPGRIRRAGIDELLDMEEDAAEEVHKANLALRKARDKATEMDTKVPVEPETVSDENTTTPVTVAASVKEKVLTPPRSHRRVQSLDIVQMPSDLGLESELYSKSVSFSKEGKDGELRKRVGSDFSNASKAMAENTMSSIMEEGKAAPSSPLSLPADGESEVSPGATSGILLPGEFESEDGIGMSPRSDWEHVESIVADSKVKGRASIASGRWTRPSFDSFCCKFKASKKHIKKAKKWAKAQTAGAVEDLARESTYAVVTFTSRQAAVAARNCLADGRGVDRWVTLSDLPISPLADASSCDPCGCRNCCRPVTLSINDRQKSIRHVFALILLAFIYVFYTVPLTAASNLVDAESLDRLFPGLKDFEMSSLVSGFATALIWSAFFAVCPTLFKSIANFGSRATSVASAEFSALQYYWWFMVVTAFSGQLLATMFIRGTNDGLEAGFRTVIRSIALAIPATVAASWLNWIIFRCLITLPCMYLLQLNTFLFSALGMNCCARLVRGGGPGGPVPYRIFVDSGVVLLCALALAPASPLVAVACFVYFLFTVPLLRRNVVFMYRPIFDGGGLRWPFVFEMSMSALYVGQVLLTVQMILKSAIGPAIAAGLPIIPSILFHHGCRKKFLRAFKDAALLQTSLLDGWDTTEPSSVSRREEFRRFLVDSHKAAYVPVCIAGTDKDGNLTAEPAVVVSEESDLDFNMMEALDRAAGEPLDIPVDIPQPLISANKRLTQHGATLRRAVNNISARRRRGSSVGSDYFNSVTGGIDDDFSLVSPFGERSVSRRDLMQKKD